MLTSEWYLHSIGWHPTREYGNRRFVEGPCILHRPDEHASFFVDRSDQHGWCWVCRERLTVIGMINAIVFGLKKDKDIWAECYAIARTLNGGPLPKDDPQYAISYMGEPAPAPTEEEQAILTAAMHWFHEQWSNRAVWAKASLGRQYATQERGILPETLTNYTQLGWAPPSDVRYNRIIQSSFVSAMRQVTEDWRRPAAKLGLVWEDTGYLAVKNRVMFCCTDPRTGACIFYQGRRADFPGVGSASEAQRKRGRYMSAWSIRKAPFMLPVHNPILPGTLHIESPIGPTVIAAHGLFGVGWMGTLQEDMELSGMPAPHWEATDTDAPKRRRDGSVYFPGDEQAAVIAKLAEMRGEPHARIKPPGGVQKGIDEWVHMSGPGPLIAQIRARYQELAKHAVA